LIHPIGVAPYPPPRLEGTVTLPEGRRLGYAEYGDPSGPLVLWFHGTPGARRQIPLVGRRAADDLGLRLVCVERPGVGDSSDHAYAQIRDWAADVAVVADRLGHDRFMIVGLSGGGPYALACAHQLADRVAAIALLGSVTPAVGDALAVEGPVAWAPRWGGLLRTVRHPLGFALSNLVRVIAPLGLPALHAFTHVVPDGDRRVLLQPEIQSMFIGDLVFGTTRQCRAVLHDVALFGRPWGFPLAEVTVPVHWWHGDVDPFVPLADARQAAALLPRVDFVVRPGESHLGEFAHADKVLAVLAGAWRDASNSVRGNGAGAVPAAGPTPVP
jgi:pimeloyl-ACP methyl ester carboxylesterase